MNRQGLVFGLLDTSRTMSDSAVAATCRDLTISWSRYDYHGSILEADTVDGIVEQAQSRGYRFCFLQAYGNILRESWTLANWQSRDFYGLLEAWADAHEFLAAGPLVGAADHRYGFDGRYLLVDLQRHAQLGSPRFGGPGVGPAGLPDVEVELADGRIVALRPAGERSDLARPEVAAGAGLEPGNAAKDSGSRTGENSACSQYLPKSHDFGYGQNSASSSQNNRSRCWLPGQTPAGMPPPGWHWIAASLRAGLPVLDLGPEIASRSLSLGVESPERAAALGRYRQSGIEQYGRDGRQQCLSADQRALLEAVARQTRNARRGVFLLNIESYADVEVPPAEFQGPVSSLYSVASGFKPNRILATHGMDRSTRVVYFDYSASALRVKQYLVDQWDGRDFPRLLRHLFELFPYPETFYHLWGDISPAEMDWADLDRVWQRELARWGGADALAEHWRAYRQLPHEYIHCDLLVGPAPLLERVERETGAVMWWSNAFFTMLGNWLYSLAEREQRYLAWVKQLAEKNPALFLYGSDYNNTNVNYMRAGAYYECYRRLGASCLEPGSLPHKEIRM